MEYLARWTCWLKLKRNMKIDLGSKKFFLISFKVSGWNCMKLNVLLCWKCYQQHTIIKIILRYTWKLLNERHNPKFIKSHRMFFVRSAHRSTSSRKENCSIAKIHPITIQWRFELRKENDSRRKFRENGLTSEQLRLFLWQLSGNGDRSDCRQV